ncbi:ADP-ribosylglycohydrolase family protein [Bradyrhizobium sp. Pear76]|uniref:ADP-ribosylglycohydrolase family protein n=1 Tax=Bradyrhizobium oropedii TaxID=1571201 RepID=UPI00308441E6|nr:ADP-ribosylglycohydrolase family protein [Bradyrhizobium oropedii]
MRDALVTHGHPHGFCGAVFHALCLDDVINRGVIPGPNDWQAHLEKLKDLGRLIALDPQLATFWLPTWESEVGRSLSSAIERMVDEARNDIDAVLSLSLGARDEFYHQSLEILGCLSERLRGSGFKTALAAAILAYAYKEYDVAVALVVAANELESDTDTIATMAGALLGGIAREAPEWDIQDHDYIVAEARRLAAIARGETRESFSYPDVGHWNPPTKQTASIGRYEDKLAIAGLGLLRPISEEYKSGDAVWQWFALPFGQSILAKRKANLRDKVNSSQLPGPPQHQRRSINSRPAGQTIQSSLPLDDTFQGKLQPTNRGTASSPRQPNSGIDEWTDAVIRSNFEDAELGRLLNHCIDSTNSVDAAIAFSAIVAKAKLARKKRR